MSIHFNRREFQELCEDIAREQQGLSPSSDSYEFKSLILDNKHIPQLLSCCYRDAVGYYYNAIVSFAQGLYSFTKKNYSWSTVQLYYSVFYSCRAILGFDKFVIIRKGNLFRIKVAEKEKAQIMKSRNDHKATIDLYIKSYKNTDFLLSNNIDDSDFFTWIANLREITHYRQNHFKEPNYLTCFDHIVTELKSGKTIGSLLEHYSNDWQIYCFQEEFAAFIGPYRLITDVYDKYIKQTERISTAQHKYIEKIFKDIKWGDIVSSII